MKTFDFPVLLKRVGDTLGIRDICWLEENGFLSSLNITHGEGKVASTTAFFSVEGRHWAIVCGLPTFGKDAGHHLDFKVLKIYNARDGIKGHSDWDEEQVISFLIDQIQMMPSISSFELAFDCSPYQSQPRTSIYSLAFPYPVMLPKMGKLVLESLTESGPNSPIYLTPIAHHPSQEKK